MTTSRTEPSGKPGEVPARDWAAVVAGVLAVIGLLVLSWRHADLRTSAIVLLGLALACGLAAVLIGWGPYYLARRRAITSDQPPPLEGRRRGRARHHLRVRLHGRRAGLAHQGRHRELQGTEAQRDETAEPRALADAVARGEALPHQPIHHCRRQGAGAAAEQALTGAPRITGRQ